MKKRILILVLVLFFALISIQYKAQHNTLIEMYNTTKSENKEATNYFIKSMGMMLYIERLHYLVNYDNLLMKPLFILKDKYYKKGKSLLSKDSSEDVFWWMMINRGIYGITIDNILKDQSLDPVKIMSPKEYKKFNEKVYLMLIRYLDLNNDFNKNIMEINKYKLLMASDLLNHYYRMYRFQYKKGKKSRGRQGLENKEHLINLINLYNMFIKYSKQYSKDTFNKDKTYINNNFTKVRLLSRIYYTKQFQLKTKIIGKEDCENKNSLALLNSIKNLYPYRDVKYESLRDTIFKYWIVDRVVQMLNKSCDNLKEESKEVLELIQGVKYKNIKADELKSKI